MPLIIAIISAEVIIARAPTNKYAMLSIPLASPVGASLDIITCSINKNTKPIAIVNRIMIAIGVDILFLILSDDRMI